MIAETPCSLKSSMDLNQTFCICTYIADREVEDEIAKLNHEIADYGSDKRQAEETVTSLTRELKAKRTKAQGAIWVVNC
jgi:hypothetical protein